MPVLIIVIVAAVLLVGIAGFVAVSRRGGQHGELPPAGASSTATLERPAAAPPDLPVEAGPAVEDVMQESTTLDAPELAEPDLVEPPVVVPEKPTFRARLGKARSAFSGALGSIRSRNTIDKETWDDLEEALLRADVGIGPTQDLLDSVRA